jgi:hypothetical protein
MTPELIVTLVVGVAGAASPIVVAWINRKKDRDKDSAS